MKLQTVTKVLGGFAAAILLGAIGSGVWERLLSPLLDGGYRATVDLVSHVSVAYKDNIYLAASKGFREDLSLRTFSLVGVLCAPSATM